MIKSYEKYASQVKGFNAIFQETIKKKAQEINEKSSDWRLSPSGKQDAVKKIFDEISLICENMNNAFYEAVKGFCAEYVIVLPDDKKDHSTDIENALRVIEILGYNLDEKNLKNILEPLKGNYKALKTVLDVMRVKNETGLSGFVAADNHYNGDVMQIIDEYSGINTSVSDLFMTMENIEAIPENKTGYGFDAGQVGDSTIFVVTDKIPYSFLACSDWMIEAGRGYESLQKELSTLFDTTPQPDKDILKSSFQG